MKTNQQKIETVDDYIATCPQPVRLLLTKLRTAIQQAAPQATEKISYGMPAFHQDGNLVYFAAFKAHIGFFPTPSGVTAFADELTKYSCSKGAIQFPQSGPIPVTLVKKIVKFRVRENVAKMKAKAKKKRPG